MIFYSSSEEVKMSGEIISPGQSINIGSSDHLTQIQHKGDRVDIVDHFDKGPDSLPVHIITTVEADGTISTDY